MICSLVELLDYSDELVLCCIVLCACLLDMGIICIFCAIFRFPNVRQGCNEYCALCNCRSLRANLPRDSCLAGEGPHNPPPCINRSYLDCLSTIYHFDGVDEPLSEGNEFGIVYSLLARPVTCYKTS